MIIISDIIPLRAHLKSWRGFGKRIALVPTMGNLHAGHLNLVDAARQYADCVIVSIFVNPTQFGPNEDYANYPRTEAADLALLSEHAVDALFLPTVDAMYPSQTDTYVTIGSLSTGYCGVNRPGHFNGVATVVTKLFNIIQPDCALFGEKDFQQLAVIRKMVADLNIPVAVYSVPTVRASDGLALSSRNNYLTAAERRIAPLLYQTLCNARRDILLGERAYHVVSAIYIEQLETAGFKVDYFSVCQADSLLPAQVEDTRLVILAAAKLGTTRLIDNTQVNTLDLFV